MLKVGLIGFGAMGRAHFETYMRLQRENYPLRLTAICDTDGGRLEKDALESNVQAGNNRYDLTGISLYADLDTMLDQEKLDFVDVALPTYLHEEAAVKAMTKRLDVLCEKPMALSSEACIRMEETARRTGRNLMVAQCLRFWPAYEYLKETVDKKTFGEPLGAHFYRGGATPNWSTWFTDEQKSGGCIFDLHVHDTDVIHWIYGMPRQVSTIARNVIPGSGFDILSTNYIYENGIVVNAQSDWTLGGDYGFQMEFRANFERGNAVYRDGILKVNPHDLPGYTPELPADSGYFREIVYFADAIRNCTGLERATPQSTRASIEIVEAEVRSARANGKAVTVK